MIYHEVAIEPEAIEDLKDLGLLERMFGFEHGRLIASLPAKPSESGSWKKLLLSHLFATFPSAKHKEIELRVDRMIPNLIWHSRNHTRLEPGKNWFDLASSENEAREFSCLIGKDERVHPDWVPFQYLYSPHDLMPDFLSSSVHFSDAMKDPETFLEQLHPLLFSAKWVSFIDPHFNPVDQRQSNALRWINTVKKLAGYFRQSKRLTADIRFHTEFDGEVAAEFDSPDNFVERIRSEISKYFPPTTKLSVTAWAVKKNGIRFHARYLISDKAGVALDYGSDMGPNLRTDVALLPLEFAKKRLNEFEGNGLFPFERKASVQFFGSR